MAASMANNREVNIAIAIVNNNDLKSKAKPILNAFTSPNEGYLITHSLTRRAPSLSVAVEIQSKNTLSKKNVILTPIKSTRAKNGHGSMFKQVSQK